MMYDSSDNGVLISHSRQKRRSNGGPGTRGTCLISFGVQKEREKEKKRKGEGQSNTSCFLGYRTCSHRWTLAIYFLGFQSPKPLISSRSVSGARQATSGCVASPFHSPLSHSLLFPQKRGGETMASLFSRKKMFAAFILHLHN